MQTLLDTLFGSSWCSGSEVDHRSPLQQNNSVNKSPQSLSFVLLTFPDFFKDALSGGQDWDDERQQGFVQPRPLQIHLHWQQRLAHCKEEDSKGQGTLVQEDKCRDLVTISALLHWLTQLTNVFRMVMARMTACQSWQYWRILSLKKVKNCEYCWKHWTLQWSYIGCLKSDSESSSKFHNLALLVALVLH